MPHAAVEWWAGYRYKVFKVKNITHGNRKYGIAETFIKASTFKTRCTASQNNCTFASKFYKHGEC